MEQTMPLTDYLKQYKAGELNIKKLEALIFSHILDHPRNYNMHSWTEDDKIDYLCWLYPRICRAIEKYRDTGASFDAYITTVVYWSMKEYKSKQADRTAFEYAYWEARSVDAQLLYEDEAVYEVEYKVETESPRKAIDPLHLLILMLKCYVYVSDDLVRRVSSAIDIPPETLHNMLEAVRKLRLDRDDVIEKMKEHINGQYYRCMSFARRIQAAPEDSAHRELMRKRYEKARKRLENMRKRLEGMRRLASNKQVAEILNIPKGTIDSNMHYIKWNFEVNKG